MTEFTLKVTLENDKFCDNCPAYNYSFRRCEILHKDLTFSIDEKLFIIWNRPKECPLVEREVERKCESCKHDKVNKSGCDCVHDVMTKVYDNWEKKE